MNAVVKPFSITLRLPPSREMPRKLVLSWSEDSLTALVFASVKTPAVCIAHAATVHRDCYLRASMAGHDGGEIWLGPASFDLTAHEVQIVRATFEQFGLRVKGVAA